MTEKFLSYFSERHFCLFSSVFMSVFSESLKKRSEERNFVQEVYDIYDKKLGSFIGQILLASDLVQARRHFESVVRGLSDKHYTKNHLDEYRAARIGFYDLKQGVFENCKEDNHIEFLLFAKVDEKVEGVKGE